MRIAMFCWETLHSVAVGGVAAHVTEFAAALQRKGHDVHFSRDRVMARAASGGNRGLRNGASAFWSAAVLCRFHIKPPSCEFVAWITDPILRI